MSYLATYIGPRTGFAETDSLLLFAAAVAVAVVLSLVALVILGFVRGLKALYGPEDGVREVRDQS